MSEREHDLEELQWRLLDLELRLDAMGLSAELQKRARRGDRAARDELRALVGMLRKRD